VPRRQTAPHRTASKRHGEDHGNGKVGSTRKRRSLTEDLGVQHAQDPSTADDGAVADIVSPSFYGTILIRWLANDTNLATIHQLQDLTTASPVDHPHAEGPFPEGLSSLVRDRRSSFPRDENKGRSTLKLVAAFYFQDRPLDPTDAPASRPISPPPALPAARTASRAGTAP
jgi:hypothetical protein